MKIINLCFLLSINLMITSDNLYASDKNSGEIDIVGKKEFVTYCGSCHGSNGKGDGPIVHFLKRKPIDLTQLSKTNDNSFPFDRIWGVFDGTYQFNEHGTSEMPVWGYKFVKETKKDNVPSNEAKAKALDIILYLQVIQE